MLVDFERFQVGVILHSTIIVLHLLWLRLNILEYDISKHDSKELT
jgi:hypothetical protein